MHSSWHSVFEHGALLACGWRKSDLVGRLGLGKNTQYYYIALQALIDANKLFIFIILNVSGLSDLEAG